MYISSESINVYNSGIYMPVKDAQYFLDLDFVYLDLASIFHINVFRTFLYTICKFLFILYLECMRNVMFFVLFLDALPPMHLFQSSTCKFYCTNITTINNLTITVAMAP